MAALVLFALAGCGTADPATPAATSPSAPTSADAGATFYEATSLAADQRAAGTAFSAFFDGSSMEAGVYVLGSGADDPQGAHARDEIYVVVDGNATLELPDQALSVAAEPGTVVYVAAGADHSFTGISADLAVVVVFLTKRVTGEAILVAQPSDYVDPEPTDVTWRPLIRQGGLTVGAYLLPAGDSGDEPQVHRTDELNVMLRGTGTFQPGDRLAASIGPGSIFHVDAGVPHSFSGPDEPIVDIIIFPAT